MRIGTTFLHRRPLFCLLSLGMIFSCMTATVLHASSLTCREEGRDTIPFPRENSGATPSEHKAAKKSFAPDRIIIKFKDSLTEAADLLHGSGIPLATAAPSNGQELDELNKTFRVKSIAPLVQLPSLEKRNGKQAKTRSERKRQFAEWFERAKTRHPQRAARASKASAMPDLSHLYVLAVPEGTDILVACRSYAANPNVEYAVPSYAMELQANINDPYFSSRGSWGNSYDDMWGLKRIKADLAWNTAQGEGVVVAVVDTGLDYNHVDIAGNVWTNSDEIPDNSSDDDSNGFVDDVRGWHFDYQQSQQGAHRSYLPAQPHRQRNPCWKRLAATRQHLKRRP